MNNKRKGGRSNTTRSPRSRPERSSIPADGVYGNAPFMHAITAHIGTVVQLHTTSKYVYEGILRTFSPQFEVVLEIAHCVDPSRPDTITLDTVTDKLIFRACDIVTIHARDVDLEFATRDTFQTDTAISKFNGQVTERALERWEAPCNGEELELEATENGWPAHEMFLYNEKTHGVQTSFDQSLAGYTVPLQRKDTKDYKDAEAIAAQIANEIESTATHRTRAELENGDEEERFAAVVRESSPQLSPAPEPKPNSNTYLPPAKRKNLPQPQQQQQQQQMRPQQQTPPPSSGPQSKPLRTTPSPGVQHHHTSHHHHAPQGGKYVPPFQPQPQQPPPPFSPQTPPPPGPMQQSQHHPGHQGPSPHSMPPMGYPNQAMGKMNNGMDNKQGGHNKMGMMPNRPSNARRTMYPEPRFQDAKHHQPPPGLSTNPPYVPQATSPVVAPAITPPPSQHIQHVAHQPPPELKPLPQQQHPHQVPSPQQQEMVAAMTQQQQTLPQGRPPLEQRKPPVSLPQRGRDEQYADLKRFGQDFKLAQGASPQDHPPGSESHDNKPTPPPQQLPPPQQQQQQQQMPPPPQQQMPPPPQQIPQQAAASASSAAPKPLQQQQQPTQVQPAQSPSIADDTKGEVDKVATTLKKSTLNPNAKEFVFNPTAKPFTPRSPSTPSRPHTPQTPQPQYPTPTTNMQGMPMMMVVSQPQFPPTNQGNRFRKMPLPAIPHHHRPEIANQMQVAAATGQPLLAPAAPLTTQFAYSFNPQAAAAAHMQLAAGNPQYQPTMMRMMAPGPGGMVPVAYHPSADSSAQQIYMSAASMSAPPHHHAHHHAAHPPPSTNQPPPQQQPPPNNQQTPSPSQPPPQQQQQQPGNGPPPSSYPQPPPQAPPPQPPQQQQPHFPLMCPILPPHQQMPPPGSAAAHLMQPSIPTYIHPAHAAAAAAHAQQTANVWSHPVTVLMPQQHNQ